MPVQGPVQLPGSNARRLNAFRRRFTVGMRRGGFLSEKESRFGDPRSGYGATRRHSAKFRTKKKVGLKTGTLFSAQPFLLPNDQG
jgi:hypothetical protein